MDKSFRGEADKIITALIAGVHDQHLNLWDPTTLSHNKALDALEKLYREEQNDLLKRLEESYTHSHDDAGKGSRPQFARETETRGESYCRTQGFKSGMIIAKQAITRERECIKKEIK